MSFLQQLHIALNGYSKALHLVRTKNLWPLVLLTGFMYLVIAALGILFIVWGIHSGIDFLFDLDWFATLNEKGVVIKWVLKIITWAVYLATFMLYFSIYKYIFLIIGSPLFAYISERTEYILNGKAYDFNANQFITDIVRGIRISLRNLVRQTSLTLLFLVLSFVPIIGLASSLIILYLDSYYYGFSMLDYNCERHKLSVKQSITFISSHKGIAFGNGVIFYVLFLIPIIGIVIGAPLSAIAATVSYHEANAIKQPATT